MKQRLGIVSTDKEIVSKIREGNPDIFAVHAKNIIEFFQYNSTQPVEGIVLLDEGHLAKEFKAIHSFIRGKKGFSQTPILILSTQPEFKMESLIVDPFVRFNNLSAGYFLPVLNFLGMSKTPEALKITIPAEKMIEIFETSLAEKLGQATVFLGRACDGDEAREEYLVQTQDEIATNLLWVKLSMRILESGSKGLKEMYQGMPEEQMTEMSEKILSMVANEFKSEVFKELQDKQALSMVDLYSLPTADRNALIKNAKVEVYLFESSVCTVLLELSKYI